MKNIIYSLIWIIVPFLGTVIGSALVFFIKGNIKEKYKKIFAGFASGIMISASIWSLLLPAIEKTSGDIIWKWFPCSLGFAFGILFLMIINESLYKIESKNNFNMLMISIILHNIPEGMVVGIGLAEFLSSMQSVALNDAIMIAIGIAVQNIPDGAIVSLPLKVNGKNEKYSFWMGVASGIVEPISAVITIVISNNIINFLPYLLAFAGGAMFYVVINELIPEMTKDKNSNLGIIGFTFGFILMMLLDISLN